MHVENAEEITDAEEKEVIDNEKRRAYIKDMKMKMKRNEK